MGQHCFRHLCSPWALLSGAGQGLAVLRGYPLTRGTRVLHWLRDSDSSCWGTCWRTLRGSGSFANGIATVTPCPTLATRYVSTTEWILTLVVLFFW